MEQKSHIAKKVLEKLEAGDIKGAVRYVWVKYAGIVFGIRGLFQH